MIDMSMLFFKEGYVVNCATYEEADAFVEFVSEKFPDICDEMHGRLKNYHDEDEGDGVAFRVEPQESGDIDTGYCIAEWYRTHGYKVLEFRDLVISNDLGEFEHEASADYLLS